MQFHVRILTFLLEVTLIASVYGIQVVKVSNKHHNDELITDKSPSPTNGQHQDPQHMAGWDLNTQRSGPRFNTLPKILPENASKVTVKKFKKYEEISSLDVSPMFGRIFGSVLNRGPDGPQ